MRKQPLRFASTIVVVIGICAFSLPTVTTAANNKRPSLASTAQYKALVEYVQKLDGLVGQGTTAARKATYESELTAKLEAAIHKANALCKRGDDEAQAETEAKFKEQRATIRRAEAEESEAIDNEFAAKAKKAAESYREKVARVEAGHRTFEAKVKEQIAALRAQKAQASETAAKNAIQERITAKIGELQARRQEESQKRALLKKGFRAQKAELHTAEAKKEEKIQSAAEAKIAKSSAHWKAVAAEKETGLDAKRDSQLSYLTAKAEKGRADIASMPATG